MNNDDKIDLSEEMRSRKDQDFEESVRTNLTASWCERNPFLTAIITSLLASVVYDMAKDHMPKVSMLMAEVQTEKIEGEM